VRDSLTRFVKAEACKLGFQLTGVTSPDSPPHWSTFENWLTLGRHADMNWLATDRSLFRRADPLHILPECRSILVLGFRYPHPQTIDTSASCDPVGRIAAYTWGEDYHLVLNSKMHTLVNSIQNELGFSFPYLCYTDSGPVLERDLAQRAGLGWIGRNTCLIHPQMGSYLLLAEILLGIELDIDSPFESDRCGTCTRCIGACPTGCILSNRTLDSGRCISYLTIENKKSIPEELRPIIGNWVFGCDICQMVCPWNRFFEMDRMVDFPNNWINGSPNLMDELSLNSQEFNQKYKNTALMRARRSRYFRNAIIALANSGYSKENIKMLEKLMDDPDPLIKEHAAWAVERWK
jgi:epoxyqueuosine reductase